MAATTPTRLPIPTRQAVETMSAWTPEMPSRSSSSIFLLFSTVTLIISGKSLKGRNRVRTVKYSPAGIRISTSREMPKELPPGRGIVIRSPQSIL